MVDSCSVCPCSQKFGCENAPFLNQKELRTYLAGASFILCDWCVAISARVCVAACSCFALATSVVRCCFLCRLRVPLAAARSFCVRRTEKTVDTHMFPYIASTLLYRLHRRETQPALLSTAALSRQVESKLLDRAGSGSGHNYTVPGRWSAGALELRSSVSYIWSSTVVEESSYFVSISFRLFREISFLSFRFEQIPAVSRNG